MKKILSAFVVSMILFAFTSTPRIFIGAEHQTLAVVDAEEGLPLKIEFTHSVQRTPVVEELEYRTGSFILLRTKYKSQGVGLPFDASDGTFHRDGEWFVMDDMNRRVPNLELRLGKGTRLTITLGGRKFEVYKKFPLGTKIIVKRF